VLDLSQTDWLSRLVDAELSAHDPVAARLRLPPELRTGDPEGPSLEARARTLLVRALRPRVVDPAPADPIDAFVRPIREHVALLLDIALVLEQPFDAGRRRAELAMLFAAVGGDAADAIAADPGRPHRRSAAAVKRAFAIAAAALVERTWPPGDPRGGLPLRAGLLCIERRQLARLAIDHHHHHRLDEAQVRRRLGQARHESAVLFEALAAAAAVDGPLEARALRAQLRQLRRLDLPRALRDRARAALAGPRDPGELAQAIEPRLRPFVLGQLLVAALAAGATTGHGAFVERFAAAAGVGREELATLQAEAALLYATEGRWLEPPPGAGDVPDLEGVLERVASAVTDNVEALVTELRETGELTQLLAKAAAGHTLRDDERAKVKAQLIDLAKAVPALAIFAAPGGMLLLPLLAKLLPFNVLPSAWDPRRAPVRPAPALQPARAPTPPPTPPPAAGPAAAPVAVAAVAVAIAAVDDGEHPDGEDPDDAQAA
jgi:hypothetical protein